MNGDVRPLLTVREVVALTTLSRTTLGRLARQGQLVPVQLTRNRIGYPVAAVEAFLSRRTAAPALRLAGRTGT